jgi:hypothetical protein
VLAGSSQTGKLDFNVATVRISDAGNATTPESYGAPESVPFTAVVFQADGRFVALGVTKRDLPGDQRERVLARFNPDGTLDPTFAGGAGFRVDQVKALTTFADVALSGGAINASGTIGAGSRGELRVFDILRFDNDV